jgi:flagellar biosynthetic protein FlhB
MADSGGQEKTEKATPRRLQEARKKGNIAKSTDVNTAVVLLAAVFVLKWQFSAMGERMVGIAERSFSAFPKQDLNAGTLMSLLIDALSQYAQLVGPTIALLLVAGLVANYLQVGVLFTSEPITPKLSKINPFTGFQRLFSRRGAIEAAKAIVKMSIVAFMIYQVIRDRYPELAATVLMDRQAIAQLFAATAWDICWRAVAALAVFGALDYFYQRWEHERGLRMTKQEIKDEAKQSEGDPLIKGRIRRAQREAARRRMMSEVPKATVVITNPTHYAVALRYDRDNDPAPKVVAKGVDLVAQKIKEIAREHGVPTVENVPLARALHKKCEIDDEIPEELYATVAEILVMVQKLNKKGAKAAR